MNSYLGLALGTVMIGLCSLCLPSWAETPSSTPLDSRDTQFMLAAAQDGEREVRLGGIAATRLPAVNNFGTMMAPEHTIANGQLKAFATRGGVQVPAVLDPGHQKLVDAWTKKEAATFDRAYIDEMISAHKAARGAFEDASKQTKASELKTFVGITLPVLQHHLQIVEAVKTGLK